MKWARDYSPFSYRYSCTYTGCNFPFKDNNFRRVNLGSSWTLSLNSQKSQGNTQYYAIDAYFCQTHLPCFKYTEGPTDRTKAKYKIHINYRKKSDHISTKILRNELKKKTQNNIQMSDLFGVGVFSHCLKVSRGNVAMSNRLE